MRWLWLWLWLWRWRWLAVVLVGCAHAPSPPAHQATLGHASPILGGLPIVRGSIGGHPTSMLVDTGSGVFVVASWLAKDASLPMASGVRGIDVAGRPIQMARTDAPSLSIDGWGPIADRPAAVLDLPPELQREGIGAVLSPQMLATDTAFVEIDFARQTLRPVSASSSNSGAPIEVCPYEVDGVVARMLVTDLVVDGIASRLELDSGTNRLMLVENSPAGQRIGKRTDLFIQPGVGAGGEFDAKSVRNIPVRMGEWSGVLDVSLAPSRPNAICRTDGRIGMERLRSCVLTIAPSSAWIRCG